MKNKKLATGMYLGLNPKNTAQIMKKPFIAKENNALVFAQIGGGMSFANILKPQNINIM